MSGLDKENKATRKRAKNYTAEEEVLLVELVDAHKNCIENKKSDSVIWKQKEEAWKKIEEKFAAIIGTHRHWKTLRDKYELIKRKSKIEMADHKLETYRTGGGVAPTKISSVSAKVAAMLGDSATGLENSFDSDCPVTGFDGEYLDVEMSIEGTEQKTNEKFRRGKDRLVNLEAKYIETAKIKRAGSELQKKEEYRGGKIGARNSAAAVL